MSVIAAAKIETIAWHFFVSFNDKSFKWESVVHHYQSPHSINFRLRHFRNIQWTCQQNVIETDANKLNIQIAYLMDKKYLLSFSSPC